MEALKLMPQAFFEFLARLVPGAVALAIILDSMIGRAYWASILDAFAAHHLTDDNVTVLALVAATAGAYVGGQLAAPFGKAIQRVMEAVFDGEWPKLWPFGKKDAPIPGAYDWLRVNAAELGALAAKIRAEQTMFYAMSAILLAACLAGLHFGAYLKSAAYLVLGLSCALRGYTVSKTHRSTSEKLKCAFKEKAAIGASGQLGTGLPRA